MSDLFETRNKVEEGAQWRDDVTVNIDGEQMELTVRQLFDPEFWDVLSDIDLDELDELDGTLPEDEMEEFTDLRDKDDLDEEEKERLEELQTKLEAEGMEMFDVLSDETFNGIRQAGIYGWVPDESDVREAMIEHGDKLEEEYGEDYDSDDARDWITEQVIKPTMERATGFASFAIGIKVFTATMGDKGN